MKILGIDLGSREVKIVLMSNNMIEKKYKLSTMHFYKNFCTYNGKLQVNTNKLDIESFDLAVSTGYGRNNTDLNNFMPISELKAHAYGALYQTNSRDFVLLDIGGQDVKIMRIQNALITDLDLNDKCAASCGRYLENMSLVLDVTLEEMSSYYDNPVNLNSTCAVFSESELIGKIAEGTPFNELCAGVNFSLFKRIQPLLSKFKAKELFLSGGVSKSLAIKRFLLKEYSKVTCVEQPQYNGAIGCCIFGAKTNNLNWRTNNVHN
jgi:predicted CoA-substrate-specific enzyme activase